MISCSEEFAVNRRAFLARYAGCLGSFALAHLLGEDRVKAAAGSPHTSSPARLLAPSSPHHPPRAKSVICLFQHGGPSQMDLFDPKPELTRRHGQRYQGQLEVHFHTQTGNVLGSPFRFQRHGQSGLELSELLPHIGAISDELTLVRSMT